MKTFGQNLDQDRANALDRIERYAENERAKHVTPGVDGVYRLKADEARAVMYGSHDGFLDTPLLEAEARTKGLTIRELAMRVLDRQAECAAALAGIEAKRQKLRQAVKTAKSRSQILTRLTSIGL